MEIGNFSNDLDPTDRILELFSSKFPRKSLSTDLEIIWKLGGKEFDFSEFGRRFEAIASETARKGWRRNNRRETAREWGRREITRARRREAGDGERERRNIDRISVATDSIYPLLTGLLLGGFNFDSSRR